MIVIDASVACKLYVEESDSDEARTVVLGADALIAPDLIVAEVANVLWTRRRTTGLSYQQAAAGVLGIASLCDEFVAISSLVVRAFAIASVLEHPVYDCLYLALVEERNLPFITADRRLIARLRGTPWAARTRSLADAAKA